MSDDARERDELRPSEQRLVALLALLRDQPEGAAAPPGLPGRVVRTARWERLLREVLETIGGLAGGVAHGASLIRRSVKRGEEPS